MQDFVVMLTEICTVQFVSKFSKIQSNVLAINMKQLHRCPTCHEKLTPETLVQPPRIVTDMLSSLNITCDYVQRGCREVVELGVLERHVKHCNFVPVLCSNHGCNSILNRRDKLAHERNECEFRQVSLKVVVTFSKLKELVHVHVYLC